MKKINIKGLKLLLAGVLAVSCLAFTGYVSAESNNDINNKKNPANGLAIAEHEIIGENEVIPPNFEENVNWETEEGSIFKSGNEGEIWTDKLVENVLENGSIVKDRFKITLYAKGFPYREVNEDNKKTDKWLNPLKDGSILSVTEKINDFYIIDEESIQAECSGLTINAPYEYKPNEKTISLIFNANEVSSETLSPIDSTSSAFDVKVSFEVEFKGDDSNLQTGIPYNTGQANSSFEPAKDNYFYYAWGYQEQNYALNGLKWNNSKNHWGCIQLLGTLQIPDIDGNLKGYSIPKFNPGGNGTSGTPGEFEVHYESGILQGEYKEEVINSDGIDSIKVWVHRDSGIRLLILKIEINYENTAGHLNSGKTIVLEPSTSLGGNGGNGIDLPLGIFATKTDPIIRKDKDPDGDGIINNIFENHGQIILEDANIEGSITIIKHIDKSTQNSSQGDPIFTFKLEKLTKNSDGKLVVDEVLGYQTYRYENGKDGDSAELTFDKLERGIYRVTELDTMRYKCDIIDVLGESTAIGIVNKEEKYVDFYIGYSNINDDTPDNSKITGKAKFSNSLKKEDNFSDTDKVKNTFAYDEKTGTIKITDEKGGK